LPVSNPARPNSRTGSEIVCFCRRKDLRPRKKDPPDPGGILFCRKRSVFTVKAKRGASGNYSGHQNDPVGVPFWKPGSLFLAHRGGGDDIGAGIQNIGENRLVRGDRSRLPLSPWRSAAGAGGNIRSGRGLRRAYIGCRTPWPLRCCRR